MAGNDEERVVLSDAEHHQLGKRRFDVRDAHDVAEHSDEAKSRRERGGCAGQGERGGAHRSEDDGQNHQRREEAEQRRRHPAVLLVVSLERVAREFDLQRVTPQLRQVVVDAVEELLVIVRRLPGDVRDRDRLVRGQQGRLSRSGDRLPVRARNGLPWRTYGDHPEVLRAQGREGGGGPSRLRRQRPGLRVQDNLAGWPVLVGVPGLVQQVHDLVSLGAGQAERVFVGGATEAAKNDLGECDEGDPAGNDVPAFVDREAGNCFHETSSGARRCGWVRVSLSGPEGL